MKKKVTKRTRNRYMRVLLNISAKNNTDIIEPHAPELYELRKRKNFDREIKVLVGLGLISVVRGPTIGATRYQISPEGLCYFEKLADERWQLIVKSILIPVIVSILTAIITMYALPPLGKRAETWLQSKLSETQSHSATSAPSYGATDNPLFRTEYPESTPIAPSENP